LVRPVDTHTHTRLLKNGSTNMLDLKQKLNAQSIAQ